MHVAVLDSSTVRRTAIVTMAVALGWHVQACDRPSLVLDALDGGGVDMLLVNWADVGQRTEDDVDQLVAACAEVPVVALAAGDDGVKAALRSGVSLALRETCDPEVLLLSMRALLQHRPLPAALRHRVAVGDLVVHLANHTIERQGRRQVLSPTEWQLFAFLLAHPERTFSRHQLACGAWGEEFQGRRAEIELYVCRLRRKIERQRRQPVLIETVRNCGYRLTATPAPLTDI